MQTHLIPFGHSHVVAFFALSLVCLLELPQAFSILSIDN